MRSRTERAAEEIEGRQALETARKNLVETWPNEPLTNALIALFGRALWMLRLDLDLYWRVPVTHVVVLARTIERRTSADVHGNSQVQ
jgi:uncharacterized protein YbcI